MRHKATHRSGSNRSVGSRGADYSGLWAHQKIMPSALQKKRRTQSLCKARAVSQCLLCVDTNRQKTIIEVDPGLAMGWESAVAESVFYEGRTRNGGDVREG
jgi:hypothetical protein